MYKEPNQLANKLAPLAIVAAVVGSSFWLFRDDIQAQDQKVQTIRQQTEQTEQDAIQLDLARERAEKLNPLLKQLNAAEAERAKNEEITASARVRSNCLWVDANGINQKVIANATLIYPGTSAQIPPQTVVCDRSGNTGVVGESGAVDPQSIARTRAAVPSEYHRSGWFRQQRGKQQ